MTSARILDFLTPLSDCPNSTKLRDFIFYGPLTFHTDIVYGRPKNARPCGTFAGSRQCAKFQLLLHSPSHTLVPIVIVVLPGAHSTWRPSPASSHSFFCPRLSTLYFHDCPLSEGHFWGPSSVRASFQQFPLNLKASGSRIFVGI